jgi:hypothetical protein
MVPAVYFAVRELPMTATGKTDRKRLREMGASFTAQQLADLRGGQRGEKRQPTTDAERKLQGLWARALNLDPASIGLDDSFFRLGGDSVTAIKMANMARSSGMC